MKPFRILCIWLLALALFGCASTPKVETPPAPAPDAPPVVRAKPAPRIALALGGGAARGFAHVGVIKALEAQGIHVDIVVGTSAGSVVGALYASGIGGFELQRLALAMDDGAAFSDWSLPDRGIIKGEALQNYINTALGNRPIEKMQRTLAIVATDLQSGEAVVFRNGNAGMAVRASSAVPGLFQPVRINAHDYVDGGLVSPVPVRVARSLGADLVIAVDISSKPRFAKTASSLDVLLQTFTIMGQAIAAHELPEADLVIRPNVDGVSGTDFQARHLAIMEGERALSESLSKLRAKLADVAAKLR